MREAVRGVCGLPGRRPACTLYERAKGAVAEVGSDMQAHLVGFLRWLTHETDELPPRPKKPAATR